MAEKSPDAATGSEFQTPSKPYASHAKGERCPVVNLLIDHFGEDYGGYLLYNFTCFPCDDETAWRQAHALIGADRAGVFPAYVKSIEERQEQAMREAAGIA